MKIEKSLRTVTNSNIIFIRNRMILSLFFASIFMIFVVIYKYGSNSILDASSEHMVTTRLHFRMLPSDVEIALNMRQGSLENQLSSKTSLGDPTRYIAHIGSINGLYWVFPQQRISLHFDSDHYLLRARLVRRHIFFKDDYDLPLRSR